MTPEISSQRTFPAQPQFPVSLQPKRAVLGLSGPRLKPSSQPPHRQGTASNSTDILGRNGLPSARNATDLHGLRDQTHKAPGFQPGLCIGFARTVCSERFS